MTNFRLSRDFEREASEIKRENRGVYLSDLFFPLPSGWGLRGDKYLWGIMAAHLNEGWIDENERFENVIFDAFFRLTGHTLIDGVEQIKVPGIDYGGMSGGLVSIEWWTKHAVPLLRQRFNEVSSEKAAVEERP